MSGDLRLRVLAELGICSFHENVNDGSMCSCGLPALTHDEVAAQIVLNDHPAILALLDERDALAAKVARVEALADKWSTPESHRHNAWLRERTAADDIRAALEDRP